MKKGFTLIEVIAVIFIISILTILIVPNILNLVSNKRDNISEISKQMIYDAADLYLSENYSTIEQDTYCIKLETLVIDGKLVEPIKDLKTDKEIPLNKIVKVTINNHKQYNYDLVDSCD